MREALGAKLWLPRHGLYHIENHTKQGRDRNAERINKDRVEIKYLAMIQ
jgi:hypothetical protein